MRVIGRTKRWRNASHGSARRFQKANDYKGFWDDVMVLAIIFRSLTEECRAGKTLDEIVAALRADGEPEIAELIAAGYFWDEAAGAIRQKVASSK